MQTTKSPQAGERTQIQAGLTDEMVALLLRAMMDAARIELRNFTLLKDGALSVHSVLPLGKEIENGLYRSLQRLARANR